MNTAANDTPKQTSHTTACGIIAIVLGMCAMMSPGFTGLSVMMLVGGAVLIAGFVRMLFAFLTGSVARGVLVFIGGLLTFLCGGALLAHPLLTAGIVTVILVIYFIADGIAEISAAFHARPLPGWGMLLFGGIVSLMLGIMLWRQFPLSGVWATGVLLGIRLFFIGLAMVSLRRA